MKYLRSTSRRYDPQHLGLTEACSSSKCVEGQTFTTVLEGPLGDEIIQLQKIICAPPGDWSRVRLLERTLGDSLEFLEEGVRAFVCLGLAHEM